MRTVQPWEASGDRHDRVTRMQASPAGVVDGRAASPVSLLGHHVTPVMRARSGRATGGLAVLSPGGEHREKEAGG